MAIIMAGMMHRYRPTLDAQINQALILGEPPFIYTLIQ